jgi:tRNA A37 threonylcarbamoyladenosine modification protein TsaB
VAWHEKSQDPHLPATIAVEMPAQQGKVFGAIYQINVNNSGIKALLADQVFTLESWQETLNGLPNDYPVEYKLVRATSNLAVTVTSILHLAYLDWQQGKNGHWSDSLPYYGQQPVDG